MAVAKNESIGHVRQVTGPRVNRASKGGQSDHQHDSEGRRAPGRTPRIESLPHHLPRRWGGGDLAKYKKLPDTTYSAPSLPF